jgi:HAD superfamily hydrolase (TIGR01549 family)
VANSPQIQAWLVDLDGTLYSPKPLKALMALELLLLGAWNIRTLRAFRKQHERLRAEAVQAPSPFAEQVARTASELSLSEEHVKQVVTRWMVERPTKWLRLLARKGLLQEMNEFQALGGRLALVSDYPARHKLRAFTRDVHFDVIVANGEDGGPSRLKPDPEGYLLAATRLGVAPAACLVIGDRDDADGAAARAAGMQFRWVR